MNRSIDCITLALSVALVSGQSFAADPINSYNDGRIIQGGTYANTVDGKTTFVNSSGGGMWLKVGSNLRGIEVDASGNRTNNGGTFHFYAPDSVVRLDGNVDASALRNSGGTLLGNGGKVFVDSAYLFQNGNIFAEGQNGGLVQFNVGGMTLGEGARIEATGHNGAGGVVAINAGGPADLRRGSVIDTSGKVVGSLDTNLINIEGSLVNNNGTLRADGITAGSRGGTIRLVATGQSDIQDLKDSLQSVILGSDPTIRNQERTFLLQRNAGLISSHDGDVVLASDRQGTFTSALSANGISGQTDAHNDMTQHTGNRSGDGGTILISAMDDVVNQGAVFANGARGSSNATNGGEGGAISLLTQGNILNDHGRLEANGGAGENGGNGGNGGLMVFGYNSKMSNTGNIYADGGIGSSGNTTGHGGNGGLVMLSGNINPSGNGSIDVIARPGGNGNLNLGGQSGTIVSPNPDTLGNGQVYFQQGYVINAQLVRTKATEQTQPVELLTHHENLVLLTKNGGHTNVSENLFNRLLQARIRSVTDPTGSLGQARTDVVSKNSVSPYVYRNLMLYSSRNTLKLDMNHPTHRDANSGDTVLTLPSTLSNEQAFTGLNTLTVSNNGPVSTQVFFGPYSDSRSIPMDMWLIARYNQSLGGGRISLLANGDVSNTNLLGTTGIGSGGSINIATTQNFNNSLYFGGYLSTSGNIHGGSILVKTGQDITHNLVNRFDGGALTANGGLMGGTIRLVPLRNFTSLYSERINFISANGGLQGGVIEVNAGNNSIIEGNDALPPSSWLSRVSANGTSASQGQGGYIHIHAGHHETHSEPVEAKGGLQNGTILFTIGTN